MQIQQKVALPVRQSKGNKLGRLAVPILVLLIVSNFFVSLVHVWYFLPNHIGIDFFHYEGSLKRSAVAPSLFSSTKTLSTENRFVRYDAIPEILEKTQKHYGIVHQLPSIPDRRRMIPGSYGDFDVPSDAVHNLTYFLESRERIDEEDRPLYIYNPMLLSLDKKRIDNTIIEDLTFGMKNIQVAYVGVYRVSNFGNCHGPGHGVPATYRNYIGFALLDRELNIVRHPVYGDYVDAIIDLNQHLFNIKYSPTRRKIRKLTQYMQDCQLVPVPTKGSIKENQLMLLCNEYIMPVTLKIRGAPSIIDRNDYGYSGEKFNVDNLYGSGLELSILSLPNMILNGAKNMHYFRSNYDSSGPGFLEVWPSDPHEYIDVDFSSLPFVKHHPVQLIKSTKPEPAASFTTYDQNRTVLIDRDSGSACCVRIEWKYHNYEDQRPLLLGISHRKTRKAPKADQYNYVSRVYAFETTPPFNVVARSGFFCLGFASYHGHGYKAKRNENEQIWGSANDYKLTIRNEEFAGCPKIHFITGITEKNGNEDTVIISYGVNDCYPRMIEVSKYFLVSLLKG